MFDNRLRPVLSPALTCVARFLDRRWVTPDRLTALGLVAGLTSAGLAAGQQWWWALVLWVVSRVADGLDGSLARLRVENRTQTTSQAGGFFDIVADFITYGAGVVGVAYGAHAGFDAPWLPFIWVLFTYYINGAAFLAFSSIAERTGRRLDDGRSLSFLAGLAEGAETVVVHSVWLAFPAASDEVAYGWALVVGLSATQRIVAGYRSLR